MSIHKSHIKSRAAAGAVLVALSGFVPQPLMQSANAATATISVSGTFISGISLTAGLDAIFGKLVATAPNGKAVLATAGTVTPSKGVTAGGAPQAGTFQLKVASTVPMIDITVKGLGALTLAATGGGAGPSGTAKLTSVNFDNMGAATTITGVGTTGKKVGYDLTVKTGILKMGATVTWGAALPVLGTFQAPVTLILHY
jgi:hypothetical protein